jgi:putative endonuclease
MAGIGRGSSYEREAVYGVGRRGLQARSRAGTLALAPPSRSHLPVVVLAPASRHARARREHPRLPYSPDRLPIPDSATRTPTRMKGGWLYIMTNRPNGTLYVGVTADLERRVYQHRTGAVGSFTSEYRLTRLVYCEYHAEILRAIQREKTIKHWRRAWKVRLIRSINWDWADLTP